MISTLVLSFYLLANRKVGVEYESKPAPPLKLQFDCTTGTCSSVHAGSGDIIQVGRLQIARPSGKHHFFESSGIPMTTEIMFLRALSDKQEALCNILTLSEIIFFLLISILARNFDFRKTNVVMSLRIDFGTKTMSQGSSKTTFPSPRGLR